MKTLLYMAAFTGLFTLPGCLKIDPAGPADTIKYPTTQGDYWVYKVTNYQKNTVDTVTVTVGGSIKASIAPGNLTVLQLKWPDKIDSQYVSIVDDTLAFYYKHDYIPFGYSQPSYNFLMTNMIIYPLPIGESYNPVQSRYSYDIPVTVRMISSQGADIDLNKAIQTFTAFREEKTFLLPNATQISQYLIFTDDFVPGIGIIRETIRRRMTASGIVETWELLNCHLNNLPSLVSVNP